MTPDGQGRFQVQRTGFTTGEFDPPASASPVAGLAIAVYGTPNRVFGLGGTEVFTVENAPVEISPGEWVSVYTANDPETSAELLHIQETLTFTPAGGGAPDQLSVQYDVTNPLSIGPSEVFFRASFAADPYPVSDLGSGFLRRASGNLSFLPPRTVGAINDHFGTGATLIEPIEGSSWSAAEANDAGTILSRLADPSGPGFTGAANTDFVDSAFGVQWDYYHPDTMTPLADGQRQLFSSALTLGRFDAITFGENVTQVGGVAGQPLEVPVRVYNGGQPKAGTTVCWSTTGVTNSSGQGTTDGSGVLPIALSSGVTGQDTLTAFADIDASGCDAQTTGDPSRSVTVDWAAAPAAPAAPPPTAPPPERPRAPLTIDDLDDPEPFREANVEPVTGQVYVKLPGGTARASQNGAPRGFVPLTEAAQIPMGSELDTTRGRVLVESAATRRRGRNQRAQFYSGRFQLRQPRAAQPMTEILLKGGTFRGCPRAKGRSAGAGQSRSRRSRVRRVWGNGKGRFRTRGRYSSATVRGTTWLTEDRCDGTLTRVARRPRTNRVLVRDFVRRRNVTLRAGQRYLALARR